MSDEESPYGWQVTWSHTPITYTAGTNSTSFTVTPPLFGTWLRDTLQLQTEFYKDISNLPQKELEDWMRVNAFAAEDEIHEAMDEISWKPWAKSEFFHREAFIGECVDALHFIGNMLAAAGCTDAELNAAYLDKMERNRERQRNGYTGLDKCVDCGRATDDIIAHGGGVLMLPTDPPKYRCEPSCVVEEKPCEKCGRTPSDPKMRGYYFRQWVSNRDHPTVHSTGYGCNSCFCDPGDDWK